MSWVKIINESKDSKDNRLNEVFNLMIQDWVDNDYDYKVIDTKISKIKLSKSDWSYAVIPLRFFSGQRGELKNWSGLRDDLVRKMTDDLGIKKVMLVIIDLL